MTGFGAAASAAAPGSIVLGTAMPFAILAGSAITDVPTSSITGDTGLSPAAGSFYTGLTKAEVTGTIYAVDASGPNGSVNNAGLMTQAKNDLTTAFVSAANQTPTSTFVSGDNQLGGQTLTAGVYAFGHAATANITAASPLTLDGGGNLDSVFVFQASSDLVTASSSVVQLVNGAQACNVFWVVGSSATLGSGSTFVGTLMALTSATLNSTASVQGRILARNAAVTLDANTITVPSTCASQPPPTTTTTVAPTTTTTVASTTSTTAPTTVPTTTPRTDRNSGGTPPTTVFTGKIPKGAPGTGEGGSTWTTSRGLLVLGGAALFGSLTLAGIAVRRRHS